MFLATEISQLLGLLSRHAGNALNLGEWLDTIKKVHPHGRVLHSCKNTYAWYL